MSSFLFKALLLILASTAIQLSSGEQIQFDASHLSNCNVPQKCVYSWNNSTSWIGGKVPTSDDDVVINIGNNYVIITCDNNCAAQNVATSGNSLTFQMPLATSAVFQQINATNGAFVFSGGSFIIKNFVEQQQNALVFVHFQNTTVSIDNMSVTSVVLSFATARIESLSLTATLMLFGSELTLQNHAEIFDIMSIVGSTLNVRSGCSIPDATPSKIENSTINLTPACPLTPNSITYFYNSHWNIEPAPSSSSYYALETDIHLVNSAIKMTGVTLSVKSKLDLRNSSTIASDSPVEISYGGTIGGDGTINGDLTLKNFGKIQTIYDFTDQTSYSKLNIKGTLTLDRSSSIYLQHFESIQANSILLGDASIEVSITVWDWQLDQLNYTVITSPQGGISGSFDFMNVSVAVGYFSFVQTKSDVAVLWQRNPPIIPTPESENYPIPSQPHSLNEPTAEPSAEVIPPHDEQDQGTDSKTVIIVIESIMIGVGLILGGALLYRRFMKRKDYTEVPSFDQL
eukprot:TRINITY_DN5396_c0_g1_i1.p1 TRINITY_DN5396_c0_g1~~TRINITY_DN5396_c0_g1_i1.p1  ORF type:complete len:525 (+),score=25.08 TRINITY_DN5396_c0_g1_i1:35-1576(+)